MTFNWYLREGTRYQGIQTLTLSKQMPFNSVAYRTDSKVNKISVQGKGI